MEPHPNEMLTIGQRPPVSMEAVVEASGGCVTSGCSKIISGRT